MRTLEVSSLLGSLILFSALALGGDAGIEKIIRQQDALMEKDDRAAVLANAKAELDRAKTAANHYLLGRAYGLIGELEKAREQFDWSIEQDTASAYPYYGLGVYFMMKGNMEEAERHFRLSLKLDSGLTRARAQLGKLYVALQDLAGAEREFLDVLKIEPDNIEVRNLLAHLYLRRERVDRAIQEFKEVLRKEPRNAAALKGLAVSYGFARKTDEAIAAFEQSVLVSPMDFESYVFLKNLYLQKGQPEKAIGAMARLIGVAPKDGPVAREAAREIERIKKGDTPRKEVSLESLLEMLDSEDLEERREAMRYLCGLEIHPPPRKMVQKVSTKYESDPLMRVMAVSNVGVVGGRTAVSLLRVLIVHPKDRDPDEKVRGTAAKALLNVETKAAVPILLQALDDPSFYVFALVVHSLRKYTGRYFVDDPSTPLKEEQRDDIRKNWQDWWQGGRAYSVKLDAIAEIEDLKFKPLAEYLVPLLGDDDRAIAEKARNAFFILTAVQIGTAADLDSPEGRSRLCREALKVLNGS
jgi:tetratricopeptide (TPR) repeat protein